MKEASWGSLNKTPQDGSHDLRNYSSTRSPRGAPRAQARDTVKRCASAKHLRVDAAAPAPGQRAARAADQRRLPAAREHGQSCERHGSTADAARPRAGARVRRGGARRRDGQGDAVRRADARRLRVGRGGLRGVGPHGRRDLRSRLPDLAVRVPRRGRAPARGQAREAPVLLPLRRRRQGPGEAPVGDDVGRLRRQRRHHAPRRLAASRGRDEFRELLAGNASRDRRAW